MKQKYIYILAFFISVLIFCSCTGHTLTSEVSEADSLSPDQVDPSMVDQVIKVRGEVILAVENPMGQGGMYLTLANDNGEIGVRIQDDIWQTFSEKDKARFKEGKTITAEGRLFLAGKTLVVIWGKQALP